ncbi:MAG: acyl-CoA thioesterase [Verrucomicrobiales bacterium]|nr:acyl-CoA thioesterase [Verrucomicrobiales bacterium]
MENHRLVLPEHLNQYGFLFGGYLLMWVDEVAWMAASLEFRDCHFVTVGMKAVAFHKSVKQGSILRFETELIHCGNTSVTYAVSVLNDETEIFSNSVTLVRINEEGEKQSLPKR